MSVNTGATTSVGASCGEAGAPTEHPSWGAVKRHRRAGEPLCESCAEMQRIYNRGYARIRQSLPAYAARKAAEKRRWHREAYSDPRRVAAMNAQRRERRRRQLADLRNYVDPVVLDRLIDGEPAHPTRRERQAAVALLHSRGASYALIAARVGVSERQIHRDLTDLGLVRAKGAA